MEVKAKNQIHNRFQASILKPHRILVLTPLPLVPELSSLRLTPPSSHPPSPLPRFPLHPKAHHPHPHTHCNACQFTYNIFGVHFQPVAAATTVTAATAIEVAITIALAVTTTVNRFLPWLRRLAKTRSRRDFAGATRRASTDVECPAAGLHGCGVGVVLA